MIFYTHEDAGEVIAISPDGRVTRAQHTRMLTRIREET
jgi:hypothetical protein